MDLKRGAKLYVSCGGDYCGPLKWTLVREWCALGFVAKSASVKVEPDGDPVSAEQIEALWNWSQQLRDTAAYYHSSGRNTGPSCPRQHAYLRHLGCPFPTTGLDKHLCYRLTGDLQQAFPERVIAGETERIDDDLEDAFRNRPATEKQIAYLRTQGIDARRMSVRQASHQISPPTDAQLRKLRELGVTIPADELTKEDASALIDRTLRLPAEPPEMHATAEMRTQAAAALGAIEANKAEAPPPPAKPWWKFWG